MAAPCYFIFPADFATIYNVNGVTGGINGTGQTIAIVGRSGVCNTDITNFATQAAVTANIPTASSLRSASTPPRGLQRERFGGSERSYPRCHSVR